MPTEIEAQLEFCKSDQSYAEICYFFLRINQLFTTK